MLTVRVNGAGVRGVRDELQRLSAGWVVAVDEPAHAAISLAVLGPGTAASVQPGADAVLIYDGDPAHLHQQVARLWEQRLRPWLSALDAGRVDGAPAVLVAHDPRWAPIAARHLRRVSAALSPLLPPGAPMAYDHIGSTAVPDLVAKPFVDLQVRLPALPGAADLDVALAGIGYLPALGSRPDSSGVHRDVPFGGEDVPDEVWVKRLFFCPDPAQPVILHLRLSASPFGRYTVSFRDWLTAHPDAARRYGEIKADLAAERAGDGDYDDYTRAKSAYLREARASFEAWSLSR